MRLVGITHSLHDKKWILVGLACFLFPLVAQASSPDCNLSVTPTSGNAPLTVNANGSCSDQDGDLTGVTLSWGDGSPPVMAAQAITASHTYSSPGQFTVSFTGSDAAGGTSEKHVDVNVTQPPANRQPTCKLDVSPTNGQAPLTVSANANCQDPDGDPITVTINWGEGTPTQGSSGSHVYSQAGDFTVTATATDSKGASGSDSKQVHVTAAPPANQPPTCQLNVSPNSGLVPLAVFANANCHDPDNNIVSVSINWGDGSAPTAGTSPNVAGPHTYSQTGNFNVTATATDSAGTTGSASQRVNVTAPANDPPSCTLSVTPESGEAPVTVTATANCTDPNNDLATTIVSFGDGFYQSGASIVHVFPNGGTFTVSATASDRAGNSSKQVSRTVNISETPKLYVSVSNGQVKQFSRAGAALGTLNTNQGGSTTGMAIDSVDSLYVTNFTANTVTKFSGTGTPVGNFGSSYNCKPESIVFDRSGNAYVGQSDCSKAILKFDAYGNLFNGIQVQTQSTGSDAIDLASDQCTIFYTSESTSVLRFNACTNQQLQPFASGLQRGLALRILEDGGVVVANNTNILRFDSGGRQIQTYDVTGEDCWDALTIDRAGSSFWAADFCTSDVVRFDLNSGNQISKFSAAKPANTVFGLAMKPAPGQTTAAGPLIASPNTASIAAGQSATFSLAFNANNAAQGHQFSFDCANLPVGASCSFSPPSFTASKDGNTATLTINTAVRTALLAVPQSSEFLYAFAIPVAGLVLCGFTTDGRRRARSKFLILAGVMLLSLVLFAVLGGCGGGASDSPSAPAPGVTGTTPPGTYNVIISTRSGTLVSSTSVALSVR